MVSCSGRLSDCRRREACCVHLSSGEMEMLCTVPVWPGSREHFSHVAVLYTCAKIGHA